MKITVTAAEPKDNEVAAKLTISQQDVDNAVKGAYKDIANKYSFKGFRRGRTPRPVIDSLIGREAVLAQATNDLLNQAEPLMLEELDIVPVEQPNFGDDPDLAKEGEDYTIDVTIPVRPEVELDSYDAPAINMPPEEATEQEISDHIQNLREYYYTMRPADKEAEQGDYVLIHMTCSTQGHDINGLTNVDRLVGIGQGSMPEAFDRQLLGTKAGQSVSFDFTVTPEDHVEFNTDGTVHVDADVKEVQVKHLPEVDEAFAQKLGSSDVEELHKAVRALINQAKREQLPQIMEDRCIEALAQRIEEPIPADYVDFMRNNVLADFFNKLQEKDVNIQDWIIHNNIQSEQFKKDATEQAEALARRNVALESLFSQAGMTLDEADIQREFDATDDPEGTRKQWEDSHQMALFRQACRRNKVINWLVKTAEVNVVEEQIQSEVQ